MGYHPPFQKFCYRFCLTSHPCGTLCLMQFLLLPSPQPPRSCLSTLTFSQVSLASEVKIFLHIPHLLACSPILFCHLQTSLTGSVSSFAVSIPRLPVPRHPIHSDLGVTALTQVSNEPLVAQTQWVVFPPPSRTDAQLYFRTDSPSSFCKPVLSFLLRLGCFASICPASSLHSLASLHVVFFAFANLIVLVFEVFVS